MKFKIVNLLFIAFLIFPTNILFSQKIDSPLPPKNVQVTIDYERGGLITVSWLWPDSEGGSPISGYNLYVLSQDNREISYTLNDTNKFYYEIINNEFFISNNQYSFYLTAFNYANESEPSNIFNLFIENQEGKDVDTMPPLTYDIEVADISTNSAMIIWKTDEPTSSTIAFDVHSNDPHEFYTTRAFLTEHSFLLNELLPCTKYFYLIKSEDEQGNYTISDLKNFITGGCLGQIIEDSDTDLLIKDIENIFNPYSNIKVRLDKDSFEVESILQIKKILAENVDRKISCPIRKKPISGKIYDIKFLDSYNSMANLSKPAKITIKYEEDDLKGMLEESLKIYHHNESIQDWTPLNACIIDKVNKEVTCEAISFSRFAVMAKSDCGLSFPIQKDLFFGKSGAGVLNLNNFLEKQGYIKFEDGGSHKKDFFGFRTAKAIRKFKKDNLISKGLLNKIDVIGFVGEKTRSRINSFLID